MMRRVMKPHTLSDGTFLPEGTHLSVASGPMHWDDQVYEDARTFKPFRFVDMSSKRSEGDEDGEGEGGGRYQAVSTSTEFLTWGHGKHAWCVFNPSPPHLTSGH